MKVTSSDVLTGRDWFEVSGPHALSVTTQMIDDVTVRDRPDHQFVHHAVCQLRVLAVPELAVAARVD